jgi:hypothetical protein
MFRLVQKRALSRVLLLPWLLLWVLTVPLFHIHTLDEQESQPLTPQVLTHTVFSPDLPGEYTPRTAGHQSGPQVDPHAIAKHFPHYSEIALSVFGEDDDTKRKIGSSPIHSAHFSSLRRSPLDLVRGVIPELASLPFLLLASSVSPRAPPAASC